MKVFFIPILVFCISCEVSELSDRRKWLHETLLEDNQIMILREPELVKQKFSKMFSNYYFYFRGTFAQYYRDQDSSMNLLKTKIIDDDSALIPLLGDPHLENFGVFKDKEGRMIVDFNDFDTASYGPYYEDLRRFLLSFYVTLKSLGIYSDELMSQISDSYFKGYQEKLESSNGSDPIRAQSDWSKPVLDMIKSAIKDGDEREKIEEYTRSGEMFFGYTDCGKTFKQADTCKASYKTPMIDGIQLSYIKDIVLRVSEKEEESIRKAIEFYPETLMPNEFADDFFKIKGVSRRFGAGVGSFPIKRYYVLLEGKTLELGDDVLLQIKEATPQINQLDEFHMRRKFKNDAARVVFFTRMLQTSDYDDIYLGHLSMGDISFKVSERTGYQKDLGHDDLNIYAPDELIKLAYDCGYILAHSYQRSITLNGQSTLTVMQNLLKERIEELKKETLSYVLKYGKIQDRDFLIFKDIVKKEGLLLGFSPAKYVGEIKR